MSDEVLPNDEIDNAVENPGDPAPLRRPVDRTEILIVTGLIVGCLYLFGWGIGSYSLWDPWEPKYAQTVLEMTERGDYITPYYQGSVRWTKPILVYWAMMVPIYIGGNNELTARLPSVFAAMLGVLMLYYVVRRLFSRSAGVMAACVLATTPQYFYLARQSMPDMLLNMCIIGALGGFALGRFLDDRQRLHFFLGYVFLGLATLAKGPVAVAVVVATCGLFWLIDFNPRIHLHPRTGAAALWEMIKRYQVLPGIAIFAAVAAPWYLVMLYKHSTKFVEKAILYENIQRFSEPLRDHDGTVTYYFGTFFHGMYPWCGLLPIALCSAFFGVRAIDEKARRIWFFVSWFLGVFIIFSMAGTKLQHYLLPITPAFAVLIALVWDAYLRPNAPSWIRPALLTSALIVLITVRDFDIMGDKWLWDNFTNKRSFDGIDVMPFLYSMFAAWAVVMALGMVWARSRTVAALAVAVALANGIYFSHVVMPSQDAERSMTQYINYFIDHRLGDDSPLALYGKRRYSTTYCTYHMPDETVDHFDKNDLDEFVEFVSQPGEFYIIVEIKCVNKMLSAIRKQSGRKWYYVSKEHPRYWLLTNTPISKRRNDVE
jgi:4-amino-4-deoxy-L-arabinose transferase-like glycosyltransferase